MTPLLRGFPLVLLALGLAARVAPLLDPRGRALSQYASEDGYLMLTIARNLALGHGMSIEAGEVATNGTQPLMTFAYAGLFWLVGGDKVWGVVLAQVAGIALATAAAALLFLLARQVLAAEPQRDVTAATAAGLWYAAPLTVRYTQNGLETGAAALVVLGVALYALRRLPGAGERWPLPTCAILGLLLALAFWIRNDAVLLAAAVCLARALPALTRGARERGRRLLEAGTVGVSALAGALPWPVYNLIGFGHVMPISGISEGAYASFGENIGRLPGALAEYALVVPLIPNRLQNEPLVVGIASLGIAVWLWQALRLARGLDTRARAGAAVLAGWGAALAAFYALYFGAGYFMSRYLFPLGPFIALVSVHQAHQVLRVARRPGWAPPALWPLAAAGVAALALGLHARAYVRGTNNGHFQVVEWVEAHVPDAEWVAAPQTGTLGYFHDRTYNLDGKVSPLALEARLDGRIFEYVLERPVAYIADWAGVEGWLDDTALTPHFELALLDRERNLAVLRRVGRVDGGRGEARP